MFSIRLPETKSEYVMNRTPLPRLPPVPSPLLFLLEEADEDDEEDDDIWSNTSAPSWTST